MNRLTDQAARQRALDPSTSFIVQAPAGSGKTELLTQRYLCLLSQVNQAPEEIKALTFTRKAAAEMRSRIIQALQRGQDDTPPDTAHGKITWKLARQALAHDQAHNWKLISNPNRLCIQTIDALCAGLASQAPILSQLGGQPNIAEDATTLYQQAAETFIQGLDEDAPWQSALADLLMHLDNNTAWLTSLFTSMLAKRDQWLPRVLQQQNSEQLRKSLENSLKMVTQEAVLNCSANFDQASAAELMTLIQFSDDYRDEPLTLSHFPSTHINDLIAWQKIAKLLLTTTFTWRKSINKNQGFPPSTTIMKKRMTALINTLRDSEELRIALQAILQCPPMNYTEPQWHMVKTLLTLLPYLAAQLRLVFQQHNSVDFIEISNSALTALGTANQPTQLALNLDYKIQHLLIDEFQDTSISQFHLLEQLTSGWQPDDGRTLFLVGDPMQSIYRFRQAEVGLFIHAREHGLGDIRLESLQLQSNFRSEKELVNWFNKTFSHVFPTTEDISAGAVSYAASVATQADTQNQAVYSYELNKDGPKQEIKILELIKQYQKVAANDSIVILVRSRSHLWEILSQLKLNNIPFQAVDLENLSEHSVIHDLLALTKALSQPADRLSWLAILRAPWCGLSLAELHQIAVIDKQACIWQNLQNYAPTTATQQLTRTISALQSSLANRSKSSLRELVESTWLALGGPACVNNSVDLDYANRFFDLLEAQETAGMMTEFNLFQQQVMRLFANQTVGSDCKVHVMTMHKAKGLEFDHVILPSLHKRSARDKNHLLFTTERTNHLGETDLIMAPIKASNESDDPIYTYLQSLESQKQYYESMRLLYVAATRAKKTLHLFADIDNAGSHSLFSLLPEQSQQQFKVMQTQQQAIPDEDDIALPAIQRLTQEWQHPGMPATQTGFFNDNKPITQEYINDSPRIIGIAIHELLQKLTISTDIKHLDDQLIKTTLRHHGILPEHLSEAINQVKNAINTIINDPQGQWILSDQHSDAKSEYALTTIINGQTKHLVIDRTFIDENGTRWIIDYKTAIPADGKKIDDFLQQQQQKYQPQLEAYAQAMQMVENRPTQLGLYFPGIGAWQCWEAKAKTH